MQGAVILNESYQRPDNGKLQAVHEWIALYERRTSSGNALEKANARSKTVQSVDKIYCIGNQNKKTAENDYSEPTQGLGNEKGQGNGLYEMPS